jgi:large subunit ribosomal protein L10
MVGPLVFGISADPVATAKVMNNFAKANDKFVIKAGAMPNQVLNAAGVQALAAMPVVKNCSLARYEICTYRHSTKCQLSLHVRLAAVSDQKQHNSYKTTILNLFRKP